MAGESFAKGLQTFEPSVLVNNKLCRKLLSSLESPFDESFYLTSVLFFIPGLNSLRWELENFTFNVLCWIILY